MEDSIFTKIINGVIPCHKVYEDDSTFAFMDIHPLLPFHTLLVPKVQVDDLEQLSDQDYAALMSATKKLSQKIKSVTGCRKVVLLVMGFDIPHAHLHLLPANSSDDFYHAVENRSSLAIPSSEELAQNAKKLMFFSEPRDGII